MGSPTAAGVNAVDLLDALFETRERTLALVAHLSEQDLQRVHSPLMSPLVWDLGHIAAFEDLWLVHRYGGGALLRDDLAGVYDAFESPRAGRGQLPFLDPTATREYLAKVRSRTLDVIDERGVGDGWQHELVLRHEQQHGETMLQTLQLARLPGCEPAPSGRSPSAPAPSPRRPLPPVSSSSRWRPVSARSVPARRPRRRSRRGPHSPMTTSGRATAPTYAAT